MQYRVCQGAAVVLGGVPVGAAAVPGAVAVPGAAWVTR